MGKNNFSILEDSGYIDVGNGKVILTGVARVLFESLSKLIKKHFAAFYDTEVICPNLTEKKTLNDAEYNIHFPQNIMNVKSLKESPSSYYIPPAACYHIYEMLRSKSVRKSISGFCVVSPCGRFEGNKPQFPMRLLSFTMLELVLIGHSRQVNKSYKKILDSAIYFFNKLGIDGEFVVATDSFYAGENSGANIIQKLKELKKEFVVSLQGENIALSSINKHEDYFCKCFHITSLTSTTSSLCLAFGLERLVAYCLLIWGSKINRWPKIIQDEIP